MPTSATSEDVIFAQCRCPLDEVEVLDLRRMGIERLVGFEKCRRLRTLNLAPMASRAVAPRPDQERAQDARTRPWW